MKMTDKEIAERLARARGAIFAMNLSMQEASEKIQAVYKKVARDVNRAARR